MRDISNSPVKSNIIEYMLCFLLIPMFYIQGNGQAEKIFQTFKDTRVINSHSVETLPQGKMDIRIGHRFGDISGSTGGWQTFYGLENASDILFGTEYGITNNLMVGLNRTKGAGTLKQNLTGLAKFRIINQESKGNQPFSLAFLALSSYSTMKKSETPGVLNFFEKKAHRLSYHMELMIARKFHQRFSLQFSSSWTFRNIVASADQNAIVAIGASARIQVTKSMGLILEGRKLFSSYRTNAKDDLGNKIFYMPLGFGLEWDTGGGHIFQMNFTNATGLMETDFIPYTTSNWLDGEFRLGFTISRLFTI